jgi:hypothetical protein
LRRPKGASGRALERQALVIGAPFCDESDRALKLCRCVCNDQDAAATGVGYPNSLIKAGRRSLRYRNADTHCGAAVVVTVLEGGDVVSL